MIKVESDMLILDSYFTKDDVKAIDQFVKINVNKERERIITIVDEFIENSDYPEVVSSLEWLQDVIKGENK